MMKTDSRSVPILRYDNDDVADNASARVGENRWRDTRVFTLAQLKQRMDEAYARWKALGET